ncbi:tail fiber domain-containing protein [Psychroserpens sp. XS_ASV72]|uniref:tail fiber domain-containing protein n=1 Tax=Psychroserpens sp. XS_ASV72 TaxID=3241293 RepID=UPI003512A0B6
MKRFIIVIGFCFGILLAHAQVGVGTTNPNATLDIRSSNQATPINTDGILIPKVDVFPTGVGANQDAMLVYLTTTVGSNAPGFYYYNHSTTTWLPIGNGAEKIDDLIDGKSDNDGTENGSSIFLGIDAGLNDDHTDNRNVGIGFQALSSTTSGAANTALGYRTLENTVTSSYNTGIGYLALYFASSSENTGIGGLALSNTTVGNRNTALGYAALFENTTGSNNTALGRQSLQNNTIGFDNIGVGALSLQENTEGLSNVAVGNSALRFNTTSSNNTAIGASSLRLNITGSNNTSIGFESLYSSSSGSENTGMGYSALRNITTGSQNVAIGVSAGSSNSTGSNNVFLGYYAGFAETGSNKLYIESSASTPLIYGEFDNDFLQINGTLDINGAYEFPSFSGGLNQVLAYNGSGQMTWLSPSDLDDDSINNLSDGKTNAGENSIFLGQAAGQNDTGLTQYNIGIGPFVMQSNTNGEQNVAIGNRALQANTDGNQNVAIGDNSLIANTTGSFNTSIGTSTLSNNNTASFNTALGYASLSNNQTGIANTAIGTNALQNNIGGDSNVAIGNQALLNNTADYNNAIGSFAMHRNTVGTHNIAMGYTALYLNVSGTDNTALGYEALRQNTTNNNTAIGSGALRNNTTGLNNTAVGVSALFSNTVRSNNTAIGNYALTSNTDGTYNTSIGTWSMNSTTTGFANTAIGTYAMSANQTGIGNVVIGSEAAFTNVSGNSNIIIGQAAFYNNNGGSNNVAIGFEAMYNNLNTGYNVAVGSQALRNNSGISNTAIGYDAGRESTGSNNIFLGYRAGLNETGSNKLYIENSNADANNALIYGDFGNDLLRINGRTEITATTDASGTAGSGSLEISNSLRLDGNEIITNTNNTLFIQSDNNGDVEMDGGTFRMDASTNRVGVNTNSPDYTFSVAGQANFNEGIGTGIAMRVNGDEALWYNGTYFSWGFGGTANYFADNIGISTTTPVTRLQVAGNLDTSLTNHGLFVLGDATGVNISMDTNEIMARNNGSTSDLYLQNDGGNVRVGGAVVHTSDKRLKKNIETLPYGITEILNLKPKQYYWKHRPETDHKSFGLIAQEVQEIIPELVLLGDDEQQTMSVNYTELIPILINAIHQQQQDIEQLERKLEIYKALESRIEALETKNTN